MGDPRGGRRRGVGCAQGSAREDGNDPTCVTTGNYGLARRTGLLVGHMPKSRRFEAKKKVLLASQGVLKGIPAEPPVRQFSGVGTGPIIFLC